MLEKKINKIKQQKRTYWIIGGALIILTAVSFLSYTIGGTAVSVALLVAGLQALLAMSIFMHLSTEKRVILLIIGFTIVILLAVLLLPASASLTSVGVKSVP